MYASIHGRYGGACSPPKAHRTGKASGLSSYACNVANRSQAVRSTGQERQRVGGKGRKSSIGARETVRNTIETLTRVDRGVDFVAASEMTAIARKCDPSGLKVETAGGGRGDRHVGIQLLDDIVCKG